MLFDLYLLLIQHIALQSFSDYLLTDNTIDFINKKINQESDLSLFKESLKNCLINSKLTISEYLLVKDLLASNEYLYDVLSRVYSKTTNVSNLDTIQKLLNEIQEARNVSTSKGLLYMIFSFIVGYIFYFIIYQ